MHPTKYQQNSNTVQITDKNVSGKLVWHEIEKTVKYAVKNSKKNTLKWIKTNRKE